MIHTDLTRKAMNIAYDMHRDQLDKAGVPYIYHVLAVAEQMPDEFTACVALLHDVLEDGSLSAQDLKALGVPDGITSCVKVLTRREGDKYLDYIRRIAADPNASIVKIADIEHNSDLSRLPEITDRDVSRTKRYTQAMLILTSTQRDRTIPALKQLNDMLSDASETDIEFLMHVYKQHRAAVLAASNRPES